MNPELIISILNIFIPSYPESVSNFSFCSDIGNDCSLLYNYSLLMIDG